MTMRSYLRLCRITGTVLGLIGAFAFLMLLAATLAPRALSGQMNEMGAYLGAFAGCALVAWGLALRNSADDPVLALSLGQPTAWGLGLMAVMRLFFTFFSPGVRLQLGLVPLGEAVILLCAAFLFGVLRPTRITAPAGGGGCSDGEVS